MKHLRWLAPVYTLAVIFGSLSSNVAPQVNISHIDKLYHAGAYCIMTLVWYGFFYVRYLSRQTQLTIYPKMLLSHFLRPIAIGAMVLSFLIGILIELGQEFIATGRTMDLWDAAANTVGIIIALLLLIGFDQMFNTTKKP